MSCNNREHVLVIKLGALGDFVQALGPFQAIRQHHQSAHITLLTTSRFSGIGAGSGFFDEIFTNVPSAWWSFGERSRLRGFLNSNRFTRVYDLQTSRRSSAFLRMFQGFKPEWSGIAKGCSHHHDNPSRDLMHTIERQEEQLHIAGILNVPTPNLDWLDADVDHFSLNDDFVLIVPGGSARRLKKRWPVQKYIDLANDLLLCGLLPVLLGGEDEKDVLGSIHLGCSRARNLCAKTNLFEVAGLARRAVGAIGNDTGPMHITAAVGCPSVVLYSAVSNPGLCGQRGEAVKIVRRTSLVDLDSKDVFCALKDVKGR